MESSGIVTVIREVRAPGIESASQERRKINTPNLTGKMAVELPSRTPFTRDEIRAFQITAVELVAAKLKEGLAWHDARDVDEAVKSAKTVKGVWPKAELLARLRNVELFQKALLLFGEIEAVSAVA